MKITVLKGQPNVVRVSLDVTYADVVKVGKFSPAKLEYVDAESKKTTFTVITTATDIKSYGLGIAAAAAKPTEKVVLNFAKSDLDVDDLGVIATKLEVVENQIKAAVKVVAAAAEKVTVEE